MSEKILNQILSELKNVKSQLDENTQLIQANHDRQKETDAKLESMSMDFHKMHGDITSLKENSTHITKELSDIKGELMYTSHKTHRNEVEIFILRREHPTEYGDGFGNFDV